MLDTSDRKNCYGDFVKRCTPKRCGDRDLPVLSVTKEKAVVFQEERFDTTIASQDKSNYLVVPRGYIVQGIHIDEGNFGLQNIVDEGAVSPAYKLWEITSEDVIPELLEFFLRSDRAIAYYRANFQGTTVARRQTIRTEDLLQMPINFPSYDRQLAFLDFMRQTDKSKFELESTLEQLKATYKRILIENLG